MFYKCEFVQKTNLNSILPTTIKFQKNLEITVTPMPSFLDCYKIENIKGDLEITKITATSNKLYGGHFDINIPYNKINKIFPSGYDTYTFHVSSNMELKEICAFKHQLHIPVDRLEILEVCQFFKDVIILPGFYDFKFTCYIKKIGTSENDIEIHIENPLNFIINGKKDDYKILQSGSTDINLTLTFFCDLSTLEKLYPFSKDECGGKSMLSKDIELTHFTVADESRPQSVIPSIESNSKWCKIMSNEKYADIFLISSDLVHIPSHRCILAEFSPIFTKIIDETCSTPIQINVEDFDAETIKAVLEFLYGKFDSIIGKEDTVFKFAVKYEIQNIQEACCSYFEKSVNPADVCEYIQIAYSNNFEELKQKCLKILVEKKKEIDASKFTELPKNILFDFFKFF